MSYFPFYVLLAYQIDLSILGKNNVCFQAYDSACHLAVPTGALTKPKVYPGLMCTGRRAC